MPSNLLSLRLKYAMHRPQLCFFTIGYIDIVCQFCSQQNWVVYRIFKFFVNGVIGVRLRDFLYPVNPAAKKAERISSSETLPELIFMPYRKRKRKDLGLDAV